ncbi:hypothetical protein XENTR_v10007587 [Xenopus tropicalis]|nr:hypothetical protein XENTR_v10007587 [Xenopus tropicalis]
MKAEFSFSRYYFSNSIFLDLPISHHFGPHFPFFLLFHHSVIKPPAALIRSLAQSQGFYFLIQNETILEHYRCLGQSGSPTLAGWRPKLKLVKFLLFLHFFWQISRKGNGGSEQKGFLRRVGGSGCPKAAAQGMHSETRSSHSDCAIVSRGASKPLALL